MSIYDLEAAQEGAQNRNQLIDIASSMVTMTVSFVFCAVFIAVVLSGNYVGWMPLFYFILKAVLTVGLMVCIATVITTVFSVTLVRRVNSMVLGMVMAFGLIVFNLL